MANNKIGDEQLAKSHADGTPVTKNQENTNLLQHAENNLFVPTWPWISSANEI